MPLPNRAITVLALACGALAVAYLALMMTTIFFATLRTERMAAVRELESSVSSLEGRYYDAIASLSATNVSAEGYVTPSAVEYVSAQGSPTVTRADR